MPKSITATDVTIENLTVQADENGAVTGLTANANVAYGETRVREQFDLWAELTATQRTALQGVYDRLTQRLQEAYLA